MKKLNVCLDEEGGFNVLKIFKNSHQVNFLSNTSIKTLKGSRVERKCLSSERSLKKSIRILLQKAMKIRKDSNCDSFSLDDFNISNSVSKFNKNCFLDEPEVRVIDKEITKSYEEDRKPLVTMGDITPSNVHF
mmetsp:Transcript_20704/g.18355  ORF Transcript_20704/g.18355 Transcript_20704/m.18355 type:complete len:133 (+) Transcript_20704:151-549(+)